MFRKWLQQTKKQLTDIERQYETAGDQERIQLRNTFRKLRRDLNELLDGWIDLEEQMTSLLNHCPDLGESEEELSEEFFLDSQAVRAFREGQGFYQLKMFAEARPYFQIVVQNEPEFLLGRLYLALSDFQEGKLMEAHREFQMVAETSDIPRFSAFAYHMLGCIHVRKGQDSQAIRQFEKSLSIEPDREDTLFNMATCHFRLRNYHESIPLFMRVLDQNPEDWESMYYLSCCYEKLGQWEYVTYWRMASFRKAKHPSVMESIAHHFEERGENEQAVYWYQKVLKASPERTDAYHGLSWNLWLSGQPREAIASLQKGLTLAPDNQELLFTYVWYCLQEGDLEQVQKSLARIPETLVEHPIWLVLQSRISAYCGDLQHAETMARRVIHQTDPLAQSLGYYQLGRVLLEQHQTQQAVKAFQKAQEQNPHWADPVFYEGLCYVLTGQTNQTRQCWETILK
ncbi:tetratricopeptide repeat protein [Melghirimyces algeriensis]|uniref:Tetratricopeptide repeat-containing protein n=1 Tax=Melghirimyces algeriensis TaxID=910412 RepID=A0A521B8A5_9BACL|nr:tetratricopeptide repeat protein [Melghirimyces algeriensis]SMO43309.1 Tetratricopeptide repeat-containing protein [Melghirimyces algeriensis]